MSDEVASAVESIMSTFDTDAFERDPARATEAFFAQLSIGELRSLIAFVAGCLAERAARRAGLSQDRAVLHRAMAKVVDDTPGAETLADVLDHLKGVPLLRGLRPEDELYSRLADELIEHEETSYTHGGRVWCEHEVQFVIGPQLEGDAPDH